jgi:hypothetical protein
MGETNSGKNLITDTTMSLKVDFIIIRPDDVDWQGKLLEGKELPVDFIDGLPENVELRLVFCGKH